MSKLKKAFTILTTLYLYFLFNTGSVISQSLKLFINEFMASNQQTISDNYGQYDDWIEIYNGEDFDINLNGYYLTDELTDPMQWAFPNVIIPAKGYLLIWADDNSNQLGLHTNFKLSKDGEQVGLYKGTAIVDSITYGSQYTDVSYGRKSDGDPAWVFFEPPNNPPTPQAANVYVYMATLDPPQFLPGEGFFTTIIAVQLTSNDSGAQIYYTLDGSEPTTSSAQYTNPIVILSSTTIRAICYKQPQPGNEQLSKVATRCYLLNIDNAMPLIVIACDPGDHDDIYTWPQPGEPHPSIAAHFKFFDENHALQGDLPIALSMRGGFSLLSPKKSYEVSFTEQNFQYDLFDQPYNYPRSENLPGSFRSFNLSGMAADYSLIRNYLCYQLLRNAGANSPQVAFARLFINGNDRGIYFPLEKVDRWLVRNRFGNYDYDIIKTGIEHKCNLTMENANGAYFELKQGDFNKFNDLISWLNAGSHSYNELNEKLDIASFLYYDLICRYSNNKDSYDINYYLIRNREIPGSKWIILLWDTDESFGWDSHVAGNWYPYNKAFSQLRQTAEYIRLYQNTLADLMNTNWSQSAVSNLVEQMEQLFQSDNPADEATWNETWYDYAEDIIPGFNEDPNYNPLSRYKQFAYIKDWIGERIAYKFSRWSDGTALITINPPAGGEGSIQLNSVHLSAFPWTGTYFKEIPIRLKAIPGPGFLFAGWSDSTVAQSEQISITLHGDYSIHAIFEPNMQIDRLIINEINYNSAPDFSAEDWIELYNPSDQKVHVSGWHLRDDDDRHDFVFPGGTTIEPYGFMVVCRDTIAFLSLFPGVNEYIGNIDFGLSRSGDQVRLFNPLLTLIDSVAYDDRAPWPTEPDGNGATLELIDPGLNNTLPENWQASLWHGTPGQKNSFRVVINEINYNSAAAFNPGDWIELYNPSARIVNVSGWHLKDDNNIHDFTFPRGTAIAPHGFLILCFDQVAFQNLFPGVTNIIGDFNFGLSGGGDDVKIYNESYYLVDSVTYDDNKPWATEADGNGPTLELLDPALDNTIAQNWQASSGHGSPGQPTRALPVVTRFIARDSSGSTIVTNSPDVLIEMSGKDYDGQVVKWHINETDIPPLPEQFLLENKPNNYHINSEAGNVTLYGWILDNDNQVSRLTDTSHTTIRLVLNGNLVNISGKIHYINGERPVPGAKMTLAYAHGADSDTTDENGIYAFTDADTGYVRLKPSKSDDIGDAIRGSDVLLILQNLANLVNMTAAQKLTANVSEDNDITDADARAILRYLSHYTNNIGSCAQWRFVPGDYSLTLQSNTTLNFKAYLAGDTNLDWRADSASANRGANDSLISNVMLKIDQIKIHGSHFTSVPVAVETDSEAIHTILFSLQYDPEYLIYKSTETTDLTRSFMVEANGSHTGKVHIAMAGVNGFTFSDAILKLKFEAVDPSTQNHHTSLTFTRALVNDLNVNTAGGEIIFTDTSDIEPVPAKFALYQNYPNPFNSETQIHYQIPELVDVQISIFNLMGNEIRTIVAEQNKLAGSYRVSWDGRDNHGTAMPSGIYVFQLRAGKFVQSKKMIMIK